MSQPIQNSTFLGLMKECKRFAYIPQFRLTKKKNVEFCISKWTLHYQKTNYFVYSASFTKWHTTYYHKQFNEKETRKKRSKQVGKKVTKKKKVRKKEKEKVSIK